jgi:hypothetical protein
MGRKNKKNTLIRERENKGERIEEFYKGYLLMKAISTITEGL